MLRLALGLVLALAVPVSSAAAATENFTYTGAEQQYVVPDGVTSLHVVATGGQGGQGTGGGLGGANGRATGDIAVTPGQVLYLVVGGDGLAGSVSPTNAFNGGGRGASGGGGGGGATDVRTVSIAGSGTLDSRLIVAGGGGGSPANQATIVGGDGGGAVGQDGTYFTSCDTSIQGQGRGGTQTAGGTSGGSAGTGGNGVSTGGGGGGGGWFGGGGGVACGGGGGGSGHVAPGVTNTLFESVRAAASISLTYEPHAPDAPTQLTLSPPSGSDTPAFAVSGSALAGSVVTLYTDAGCTAAIASGSAATFASPGLGVAVATNSTVNLYVAAANTVGRSACVGPLSFSEVTPPPPPPGPPTPPNPPIPPMGSAVSLITKSRLSVGPDRKAKVLVTCKKAPCTGVIVLTKTSTVRKKGKRVKQIDVVGSAFFTIKKKGRATVKVKVPKSALNKKVRLEVRVAGRKAVTRQVTLKR